MSSGNFELVEGNYGEIQQVNYPREIKTKPDSNRSITEKYKDYLRELEAIKHEALNSTYSKENAERQIDKMSKSIARLEEKIKKLSREDVPSNYVDSRAIKLKNEMIKNLTIKVGELYKIGEEKKDEIFGEILPDFVSSVASTEKPEIPELEPDTINRQSIKDMVKEAFEMARNKEQGIPAEENVVPSVESMIAPQEEKKDEIEEYVAPKSNDEIVRDDVKNIIEDKLNEIGEVPEIAPELPKEETIEENQDPMRISKNGEISARVTKYDEEGNVRAHNEESVPTARIVETQESSSPIHTIDPYDIDSIKDRVMYKYTPMTDEEVKASQEKLGFVETKNVVEEKKDEVEPEKPEIKEYIMEEQKEESEIKPKDITEEQPYTSFGSNKTTIEGYKALKETVLKWKEKQSQSKLDAEQAIEEANAAKQKAREMREMLAESDNSVAESMALLETYKNALEEDYNKNTATLEEARERAKKDNDFVIENEKKISDNKQLVDEIHSLIGERVDPESVKRI